VVVGEILIAGTLIRLLTRVPERVPGWLLLATILALVGTGVVWCRAHLRRRYGGWDGAVDASAVLLVALPVGAAAAGGLLLVRAALRALAGPLSLPRKLLHAAAGLVCLLAGLLLARAPGAIEVDGLVLGALGVFAITLLLHLVVSRLLRDDETLAHKWALTNAVGLLVGVSDEPRIAEIVLDAAVDVARGPVRAAVALGPADGLEVTAANGGAGPVVGAHLRLDDGRVVLAGHERRGERARAVAALLEHGSPTALALPMAAGDTTHGVLLFDTGEPVGQPVRDALEWLCGSAGMCIAFATLTTELTDLAFHDQLTRLPNRALLSDQTDVALSRAARAATMVALLVLDLDGFKRINDELGHRAGDEALVIVAGRLLDQVRDGDVVTRLGGDEFAVLMTDLREAGEAVAAARRVLGMLDLPLDIGGTRARVGASIGIVTWRPPEEAEEADDRWRTPLPGLDDLLHDADTAMYAAKQRGSGYEVHAGVAPPPAPRSP
jgi:diguanylate cyclase (GGDEF)-like protein